MSQLAILAKTKGLVSIHFYELIPYFKTSWMLSYSFLIPWRSQHWFQAGAMWNGWCYRSAKRLRWCRRGRIGCWTERHAPLTDWPEVSPPPPEEYLVKYWCSPGPLWSPAWLKAIEEKWNWIKSFYIKSSFLSVVLYCQIIYTFLRNQKKKKTPITLTKSTTNRGIPGSVRWTIRWFRINICF